MERVDIKICFRCNNMCQFCVQGRKRENLSFKSKLEVENSLTEAYEGGKRGVVFTGGEPCLHPNILDFISFARKIGFVEVQIQSNGRMFAYLDFCLRAVQAGANQFSPALHGHTGEIHDFLTTSPGSFKETVNGIKNLKKLHQYVLTNSVITSKNYKYLPDLAKLLVKLGVDQFQLAFIHIYGSAAENQNWIVPRKSDVAPYVKKALDIGRQAGKKVTTEAIPYCFLEGYEDCVAERIIPKTQVYDIDFTVEDYGKYRRDSGKTKGPKCPECKFDSVCEGPWKEYVRLYGWGEFDPIKNSE